MLATYTVRHPHPSALLDPSLNMSMFTMSQQPYYGFANAPPAAPRQYAAHGTSSAFSSSANPDEDWTKISDLAERRRIQNRIAQRNYRKKLKRRLEDLERRAGSPEEAEAQKASPPVTKQSVKKQTVNKTTKTRQHETLAMVKPAHELRFTPPMESNDEMLFGTTYDERERSTTPPMFSYSTYPAPDDQAIMAPYTVAQGYAPMVEPYPTYMAGPTVPSTLPSMSHFSDAVKRDPYPSEAGYPYMTYGFLPGMDVHASYDQSNPHTPPLTHSFDHSANCSESGYEYPTTPLSMPGSPSIVQQQQM